MRLCKIWVYFIFIIFHGVETCILIISMIIIMMMVIMIMAIIILIKTKLFTGIFPRTLTTNPRTAKHQTIIISLNSIFLVYIIPLT